MNLLHRFKNGRDVARTYTAPLLSLLALLLLYVITYGSIRNAGALPEPLYFKSVFFHAAYVESPWLLLIPALSVVAFLRKDSRWESLDAQSVNRIPVLCAVFVMAWAFATMDENFALGQAHIVDRLLLLVLGGLCWWRPAFVPLFTLQLIVFISQLHFPLAEGHWTWPDKILLVDTLMMTSCFVALRALIGRHLDARVLIASLLMIVGATYFTAAMRKADLGLEPWSWALENRVSNILVSAHVHSRWLGFLGHDQVESLARLASKVDVLSGVFTMLIEFAPAFLLVSGRFARWILVLLAVLHGGIVMMTGIFFWKWIVYDTALAYAVGRLEKTGGKKLVLLGPFWGAVGLAMAIYFSNNMPMVEYSWRDSRYINFARHEAVGVSGKRYPVDARFFAPYDVISTQARFGYLSQHPVLVGTYGVTHSFALGHYLDHLPYSQLPSLRRAYSYSRYNEEKRERFVRFMQSFMANKRKHQGRLWWLNFWAPPRHFRNSSFDNGFDFQEPIVRLDVTWHEYSFIEQKIRRENITPLISVPLRRQ